MRKSATSVALEKRPVRTYLTLLKGHVPKNKILNFGNSAYSSVLTVSLNNSHNIINPRLSFACTLLACKDIKPH
jgi:hypothetical protein